MQSELSPTADMSWHMILPGMDYFRTHAPHHSGHGAYDFLVAHGFATSRACSMKSCAVGLSVRFFRVTIPTGTRAIGSSMGKTLNSGSRVRNLNEEARNIPTKRPVARSVIRT